MAPASREFQVMAKPAGPVCNLACRYCYYLAKRDLFPPGPLRMPEALVEGYIVQHLEAAPGPLVNFEWHGGEPTLLGLDFFHTVVALQRRHRRPGQRIANSLQTNGTLLDETWCRFLADAGFMVGLSLDGPADLHDRGRVGRGGQPTHRAALRAWRLLQRYRVPTDLLCVVHAGNVERPLEVYRFFKGVGATRLQFLPVVEPLGADRQSPLTLPAEGWGAFLCAVFDEWVRQDIGRLTVQLFDEALRAACGLPHALCHFRETCGDVPVVEHNGDVFACDHFVDPGHRLGTLRETRLAALIDGEALQAFGRAKRDRLPGQCRRCEVLAWCNGGCPKDRWLSTAEGEPGLNYLCAGYRRFFTHARPYLTELAALWRAGRPLDDLMAQVRGLDRSRGAAAGRNAPCPCGSGLKFKRCCLAGPGRAG